MMKCTLLFLIVCCTASAQDIEELRKSTLAEGLLLFRLEKASWHGSDMLQAKAAHKLQEISGYASYVEGPATRNIFWNGKNEIIFSVEFDSIASESNGIADDKTRAATPFESGVIALRSAAYDLLVKNSDKFFSFYERTNPNIIPVIRGDERTVFILTGPTTNDLLIGNDYRLTFDASNTLKAKAKLHNSLIRLTGKDADKNTEGTIHTHMIEDQPIMTSTDICTLILYGYLFPNGSHTVVSKKWISILTAKYDLIVTPNSGK